MAHDDDLDIPPFLDRRNKCATGRWREHLKVHPACDLFPPMERDGLLALGQDIKANGLRDPIVFWAPGPDTQRPHQEFELLDGRCRLDACELVGLEVIVDLREPAMPVVSIAGCNVPCPTPHSSYVFEFRTVEGEQSPRPWVDPIAYVLSANLHRRHLSVEQRRELVAKVLKTQPDKSNLAIARQVKVSDKTVAKVRRALTRRSEIPNVGTITDARGRRQPSCQGHETRFERPSPDRRALAAGGDVRDYRSRVAGEACTTSAASRPVRSAAHVPKRTWRSMMRPAPRLDVPGDTLFNDLPSQTWRSTND